MHPNADTKISKFAETMLGGMLQRKNVETALTHLPG